MLPREKTLPSLPTSDDERDLSISSFNSLRPDTFQKDTAISLRDSPVKYQSHAVSSENFAESLYQYCEDYSEQENELLKMLRHETAQKIDKNALRMLSSPLQG